MTDWTPDTVTRLETLWRQGLSAGEIAHQLDTTRAAVCGKLARLGLHRDHAPPTAKPVILAPPRHAPTLSETHPPSPAPRPPSSARIPFTTASGLLFGSPRQEPSKAELRAELAEAPRNTAAKGRR